MNFPYRINIFLSWEGAYRLFLGQIPYKDFGLPMGFGFWIIPALFFKLFGPYLITLVKAQAFINIISGLAFRSILIQLKVDPPIRLLSVLLYLISFSFVNFWPWYNHSVIVFEFIGISYLLRYIFHKGNRYKLLTLVTSCFFLFLSFFTKQDAGALSFGIAVILIICHCIYEKKYSPFFLFVSFYTLIGLCFILPFINYDIGYWFNYGQPPHHTRISLSDILNTLFGKSAWIKFYIFVICLICIAEFKRFREARKNKNFIVFSLLVAGILFEALIFQVTSYIPEYNNIFFHSFAIVYILSYSSLGKNINLRRPIILILSGTLLLIWWSSRTWQYTSRIIDRYVSNNQPIDTDEVSVHTFMRNDPHKTWQTSTVPNKSNWEYAPWKAFKRVALPAPTIDGMKRLVDNPVLRKKAEHLKVLNMSELTPLSEVMGYTPETGALIPLWYHKNVGIFEKQIKEYDRKIANNYYDLILFEYIPMLNNFYPFEIQDQLNMYYQKIDSFPGPRSYGYSRIDVYIRKNTIIN